MMSKVILKYLTLSDKNQFYEVLNQNWGSIGNKDFEAYIKVVLRCSTHLKIPSSKD